MLRLRVRAPFAAFRGFVAGSFRPSAPFITPSAAYGLLLNVAAIETRRDDGESAMTVTATGLPSCEIALGAITLPERASLLQQLHNYPVGATGKDRAAETFGNKYNIQPIHRELLAGIDGYICLAGNERLEERVRTGLREGARFAPEGRPRYGLPFLGDNMLLLSDLAEDPSPRPAYWFVLMSGALDAGGGEVSRLTVWIDRAEMSRTESGLYQRGGAAQLDPPEAAWTTIRPPGQ